MTLFLLSFFYFLVYSVVSTSTLNKNQNEKKVKVRDGVDTLHNGNFEATFGNVSDTNTFRMA